MNVVLLIGRIFFASIFVVPGATIHLIEWRDGVTHARARTTVPRRSCSCPRGA